MRAWTLRATGFLATAFFLGAAFFDGVGERLRDRATFFEERAMSGQ